MNRPPFLHLRCVIAFSCLTISSTHANPNDNCPGMPFVEDGFLYECNDAQALLIGCADKNNSPVQVGQRWYSPAGAFPNGTHWGFTMKCERLDEKEVSNIPVACFVNDIEIDAEDALTYNGTFYNCDVDESGKLSLTFKPVCQTDSEECDTSD